MICGMLGRRVGAEGYGRIGLDWNSACKFSVAVSSDFDVIEFDQIRRSRVIRMRVHSQTCLPSDFRPVPHKRGSVVVARKIFEERILFGTVNASHCCSAC